MSYIDALGQLLGTLALIGLLAAGGLLAVNVAGWIWYRRSGGKLGLWCYLRGL